MFTLNYIFFPAFFNLLMSWFHEKPFTGYSLWKFILHFYFWWNPNVNDWFREWIDIYLLTESPLNNAGSIKKVIQEKALPRKVNYNKRVFFFKGNCNFHRINRMFWSWNADKGTTVNYYQNYHYNSWRTCLISLDNFCFKRWKATWLYS